MAEKYLSSLEDKLRSGEATIWGEVPKIVQGPMTFRQWDNITSPCPVSDVFVVLGGVFSTDSHYRVCPSSIQNGRYDYIHKLSFYHLNPSTFRRVMEDAIIPVLSTLNEEETHKTKGNSIVSVIKTNDALQLTCTLNGHRAPAWTLRFIPAIRGEGGPPAIAGNLLQQQQWLLLPPPRSRLQQQSTWEVTCLPDNRKQTSTALQTASLRIVCEAREQNWGGGNVDVNALLTRVMPDVQRSSALPEQLEFLIKDLIQRIEQRHSEDDIPEGEIDSLVSQIRQTMKNEEFEECECLQNERQESFSCTDGPDQSLIVLAQDLNGFTSKEDMKVKLNNGTTQATCLVNNGVTRRRSSPKTSNGAAHIASNGVTHPIGNGACSEVPSKTDPPKKRRFFKVISICLVLVVVGLIFVISSLDDVDYMNLMQSKLSPRVVSNDHQDF